MVHYNPDVTLSGWQDIKIQGPTRPLQEKSG